MYIFILNIFCGTIFWAIFLSWSKFERHCPLILIWIIIKIIKVLPVSEVSAYFLNCFSQENLIQYLLSTSLYGFTLSGLQKRPLRCFHLSESLQLSQSSWFLFLLLLQEKNIFSIQQFNIETLCSLDDYNINSWSSGYLQYIRLNIFHNIYNAPMWN